MKTFSEEYYNLICDFEDFLDTGIRQKHTKYDFTQAKLQTPEAEKQTDNQNFDETLISLDAIAKEVLECRSCDLHSSRRNTVPGTGVPNPLLMVIGEGPGQDEDETGEPFVGRAGKFLDSWLEAIGLSRNSNCFIGNIVKCRPPNNRDPLPEEKSACIPYLIRQIDCLKPKAILCVGRIAAQIILNSENGIGRLRKEPGRFQNIPVFATYHPSAVLRNDSLKRPVWEDLKALKAVLDRIT